MRALLSVYDKTGIVELARRLAELGVELVSSGGTAAAIAGAGVPVIDVADFTGYPAMLGHRVVTLHPKVHGGDPRRPRRPRAPGRHGALRHRPIDLVVANLYPFGSDPSIELIDIGGPAMVRAAAKNHAHVAVLVDPADYDAVLDEIAADGSTSPELRRAAGPHAPSPTPRPTTRRSWPGSTTRRAPVRRRPCPRRRCRDAAPGGHPRRGAALRREPAPGRRPLHVRRLAGGTTPSSTAARRCRTSTSTTPTRRGASCGRSATGPRRSSSSTPTRAARRSADDITAAYRRAHECDPVSAFGGIVAVNRPMPLELAEALVPVFTEVLIAPGYDDDALEVLAAKKKNLRVLDRPTSAGARRSTSAPSTAGCWCRPPTRCRSTAAAGPSSPSASPPTPSGATSSWRGGSRRGSRRTRSCW